MKHQSLIKWCMALLLMMVSYTGFCQYYVNIDGIDYYLSSTNYTAEVQGIPSWAVVDEIVVPEFVEYRSRQWHVESIYHGAFSGTSIKSFVSNSITEVGNYVFKNCAELESVELMNVGHIKSSTFNGCKKLKSAKINSAEIIDVEAFAFCSSLETVEFGAFCEIENRAFQGCESLVSIDNDNISYIGKHAFSWCKSLASVNLTNIFTIEEGAFQSCESLVSIDLRNISAIGADAFKDCTSLKSVNNVNTSSIQSGAFQGCESLAYIDMSKVSSIGGYVFSGCKSLTSLNLANVSTIGNAAFSECESLKKIECLSTTPPSLKDGAFSGVRNCVVTVPIGAKANYKEAWGWSPKGGKRFTYESFSNQCISLTISNTAGQLMNNVNIGQLANINSLTISGEINGSDLNVINRMENLERLDLSGCRVVAGGAAYYSSDHYTEDGVLGSYSIRLSSLDSIAYPRVKYIRDYAIDKTPYLSYAIVQAETSISNRARPCIDYMFLYGDENISDRLPAGTQKVWIGRPSNNWTLFSDVKSTLEEVVIAYPYTELGDGFFNGCSKLSSIKLPSSVQKIGLKTFYGCASLPSIKITANVQQIGSQAFDGCTNLIEVICCAQTPPSASADSFNENTYKDATLYVPVGSRNAYFFDPVWGMFGNIVESEELTNGVGDVTAGEVDGPVSIYDLQGIQRYHGERDAMPTLPRGVYIIRSANGKAEKVML